MVDVYITNQEMGEWLDGAIAQKEDLVKSLGLFFNGRLAAEVALRKQKRAMDLDQWAEALANDLANHGD